MYNNLYLCNTYICIQICICMCIYHESRSSCEIWVEKLMRGVIYLSDEFGRVAMREDNVSRTGDGCEKDSMDQISPHMV